MLIMKLSVRFFSVFLACWLFVAVASAQTTVQLLPSADNSLFEENTANSNGQGAFLFAGNTNNGDARRALFKFDLSDSIPAGSVIDSVAFTLRLSKRPNPAENDHTFTLHNLTSDWGEGSSDASGNEGAGTGAADTDATWVNAFHPGTAWTNAGGDFENAALASQDVGLNTGQFFTWTSPELAASVQAWLDNPAENFGWLLRGQETGEATARRFDSKDNGTADRRPVLFVRFTTTTDIADELKGVKIRVFPNPTRGKLTLNLDQILNPEVQVKVVNLIGKEIQNLSLRANNGQLNQELDLAQNPAGIYFLQIKANDKVFIRKFILE